MILSVVLEAFTLTGLNGCATAAAAVESAATTVIYTVHRVCGKESFSIAVAICTVLISRFTFSAAP